MPSSPSSSKNWLERTVRAVAALVVGAAMFPAAASAQLLTTGCTCDCNAAVGVMVLNVPDFCATDKAACTSYCTDAKAGSPPFSQPTADQCSEQCFPPPATTMETYTCKCQGPSKGLPFNPSLCNTLLPVNVPTGSSGSTINDACKQTCAGQKVSNGDQPETFSSMEFCEYVKGAQPSGPPLNKDCPPDTPDGVICVVNPLGPGGEKIPTLIGRILTAVLGVLGSFALLMFVYGGVTWLLSGGNPEKVQKGKNIVTWAVIGMALIFASAALVRFVLQAFTSL